ncbi:Hypothetical protein CINCED_3A002157, partial [Cinara cedri]
ISTHLIDGDYKRRWSRLELEVIKENSFLPFVQSQQQKDMQLERLSNNNCFDNCGITSCTDFSNYWFFRQGA